MPINLQSNTTPKSIIHNTLSQYTINKINYKVTPLHCDYVMVKDYSTTNQYESNKIEFPHV